MTPVDYRDHRRFEAVGLGNKRAVERGYDFRPTTQKTFKVLEVLFRPLTIFSLALLGLMIGLLISYGE